MSDIMTAEYLTKLKAEMEERLGCGIEVVEDRDSSYPCKLEYARNYVIWARVFPDRLDMIGLPYKKTYESALAMLDAIP